MKKSVIIFALITATFSVSYAQFTKAGGGLVLSNGFPFHNHIWNQNRSGVIGLSFKGIYEITIPVHISPSFTIFYPHITRESMIKTSVSTVMFDINGHYVFNSLNRFEFYGLGGVDILYAAKKDDYEFSTNKESDNALGLNLGIGTYMKFTEQLDIYGEAKYVISKYDQFMLNAGILLNIGWLKKNEDPGI